MALFAIFYGVTFPIYGACAGDHFPRPLLGTVIGGVSNAIAAALGLAQEPEIPECGSAHGNPTPLSKSGYCGTVSMSRQRMFSKGSCCNMICSFLQIYCFVVDAGNDTR